MKAVQKMTARNLKLYFRDRAAVFFSLLAVLIVIALFVLFLADFQVDAIRSAAGGMLAKKDIAYLVNSWILAGLLSVTTVTATLGGFGTMVSDRESRIDMDFRSAPLNRWVYPAANVLSAFVIGAVISAVAFLVYGGLIAAGTGRGFTAAQVGQALGVIALSALMNAALMGLITSFLKTNGAFASVSLVFGTVIGFLNGLYVPLGSLPKGVQHAVQALPFMHIAAAFRQILTRRAAKRCFKDAGAAALKAYQKNYGVVLHLRGKAVSLQMSLVYIAVFAAVAMAGFLVHYGWKKKEV
ncbi:MAG: ABC transporter permease [Pseudoramibacter sp.]